MSESILTIQLALPFKLGSVNCYLIRNENGYYLIDTGCPGNQAALESALNDAGCSSGDLKIVILTHGDFDHSGNAAYLQSTYGVKIAMHAHDAVMVQTGNMFADRGKVNFLIRKLSPLLFGFGKKRQFQPDILLQDGVDLSVYGLDARILGLPGHSKGSIGVLTAEGNLFCGDLLDNTKEPALSTLVDEQDIMLASAARLRDLPVQTVFPGHGDPFPMSELKMPSAG